MLRHARPPPNPTERNTYRSHSHDRNPNQTASPATDGGFTLIELLLVLAILVVLASMVVTMFGGTQERALKDAAKGQVGIFKSGINLYKFHTRNYPAGLDGLTAKPSDANVANRWDGPVPRFRQSAARSVGSRLQVRRTRQAQRRIRSTSGPSVPMARTAPKTTSATGNSD